MNEYSSMVQDPKPALSDSQIETVWKSMLAAEIRANYFADLSQRFTLERKSITWGLLFLSSGAFATVVTNLPGADIARPTLTLLAAILSLYSLVQQNSKRVTDAVDLHARWLKLAQGYQRLWQNVYAEDAQSRLHWLEDTEAEVSRASTSLPACESLLLKWEERVIGHHSA